MSTATCSRCGKTAARLEKPPLPGEIGTRVHENTCAACWRDWLGTQVKVINEYQLSPARPEHYEFLVEQMTSFLNLRPESNG